MTASTKSLAMPITLHDAATLIEPQPAAPLAVMARVGMLRRWQAHDDETVDGTPRRYWAIFIVIFLSLCLGLAVLLFCSAWSTPARLSDSETVEIYSATIARLVAQDDTYPRLLLPPKIYLVASPQVHISDSVRRKLVEAIPSSAVVWIDHPANLIDTRDGTMRGSGVLITLDDIVAITPSYISTLANLHIAFEAGAGMQYEFEKVNGHWVIRRHRMLWIS